MSKRYLNGVWYECTPEEDAEMEAANKILQEEIAKQMAYVSPEQRLTILENQFAKIGEITTQSGNVYQITIDDNGNFQSTLIESQNGVLNI